MIGHGRWRRRVALLAADALPPGEREGAAAHVRGCARCADTLAGLRRVSAVLAEDPVRSASLPVSLQALETRVLARLRESGPAPAGRFAPRLLAPMAAAAAVAALAGALVHGRRPLALPPSPEAADAAAAAVGPAAEELLRRMERSLAREQAARYLSDAQDVLVTVAAGPPPCPKTGETIEVEDEAQRSRELLARRALLDLGRDDVASAEPVLAEVEHMLREVAALPSCVRPRRLQALEREIAERRLLMKIDLMTRELTG